MPPSAGDQKLPLTTDGGAGRRSEGSAPTDELELAQIYTLIDSILPFEACLYYQVLPLMIEGSRLVMGMVNPYDQAAEEYMKRQLAFINYSITTRTVSSEWHRDLLSKYLSHSAKNRQPPPVADATPQSTASKSATKPQPAPASAPSAPPPSPDIHGTYPTFVVDQPDELEDVISVAQKAKRPNPPASESAPSKRTPPAPTVERPSHAPLHLQVDERHKAAGETDLAQLPPKELMQALLSKVLDEGIGRLYFERRAKSGRILWSRDGVLQAVLGDINPMVFQGVINELKLLTHLSLISVRKPRQVEIERLYQETRILLRFRVMPGSHGEEATLQVLRGTALKFYQQQQIDKLGRDALDAAQTLQLRLNEIRDRARQSLDFNPTRSETLPAIIQMLKRMESQVQEMISFYEAEAAAQKKRKGGASS
jgi:type II secretory ATPase GspE/PulE/Tfp pilus assembly ATPase PilB-like protein